MRQVAGLQDCLFYRSEPFRMPLGSRTSNPVSLMKSIHVRLYASLYGVAEHTCTMAPPWGVVVKVRIRIRLIHYSAWIVDTIFYMPTTSLQVCGRPSRDLWIFWPLSPRIIISNAECHPGSLYDIRVQSSLARVHGILKWEENLLPPHDTHWLSIPFQSLI